MKSIMIMSHDNHALLEECITRIKLYTNFVYELIIVDDASEPAYNRKDAVIVRMPRQSNCCNLRNVGMEMARGDLVFWLDNDTMVAPGWAEPLLKVMDDKKIGLTGQAQDGMRVRKPFLPLTHEECMHEAQFIPYVGACDYIVTYCVLMRKEAYRPTYCYGMPTPVLDPDTGAGIKMNGYRVHTASQNINIAHLGSQTPRPGGIGYQQHLVENFTRWYTFWEPHAHRVFCNYEKKS